MINLNKITVEKIKEFINQDNSDLNVKAMGNDALILCVAVVAAGSAVAAVGGGAILNKIITRDKSYYNESDNK